MPKCEFIACPQEAKERELVNAKGAQVTVQVCTNHKEWLMKGNPIAVYFYLHSN